MWHNYSRPELRQNPEDCRGFRYQYPFHSAELVLTASDLLPPSPPSLSSPCSKKWCLIETEVFFIPGGPSSLFREPPWVTERKLSFCVLGNEGTHATGIPVQFQFQMVIISIFQPVFLQISVFSLSRCIFIQHSFIEETVTIIFVSILNTRSIATLL